MKVAKKVLGSKVGTAIAIALLLVLVIAAVVFLFYNKEPRLSVVSVSSLERVLEISEMKTVEYDYNAIAQVNKDKKTVKYYVSYKGTVNAGIDFSKIDVSINGNKKIITLELPPVEIQSIEVAMEEMKFIFTKDKYETEKVTQEAYKACCSDLEKRISEENILFDVARDNAVSSIKALFKPLIDASNEDYTIEIKYKETPAVEEEESK